ncbi:putative tetratricopeptide-like helical domain-containing protein [Rosa chinensis]|uniref:Putative tetratricopeptide-like helical domain-containing protein n=1 Tax=Rosa chinensis TaxID=74649 RepID=A0A2P6SG51_ROSCH|nr:putative tetratricopeptide-like helical domain-containing protein [Rosa chinensis]
MATSVSNAVCFRYPHPPNPTLNEPRKTHLPQFSGNIFRPKPMNLCSSSHRFQPPLMALSVEETAMNGNTEGKPRFKWGVIGPDITEAQQEAIDELPPKMSKRCQALMKQIICFSPEKGSLCEVLDAWVSIMKPCRADWLAVLKELRIKDHPLYLQVAEIAVLDESFEANVRDYTKIIHGYGKQNRIEDAENTLSNMKSRGFVCDQVTLTAMIDMYSKAGHLKLAEDTFEEIKLLGQQLDKRSYGSMIMAYIRAGMPDQGENLLIEMDAQEIYAGSEVYKALLRAYSMIGDTEGAQRVFNAVQLAGISPDAKICGLLINAYGTSGQSQKARAAFENMRKAGLKPSDKCIALMLAAYEKENKLQMALKICSNRSQFWNSCFLVSISSFMFHIADVSFSCEEHTSENKDGALFITTTVV